MQKGRIVRKSDQDQENKLPILGKVKVGRKTEKGYPESLDYFICDGKYQSYFDDAFGEKPNKIQIMFINDNFNEVCNERYECRDKDGRLSGKGDGEVWLIYDGDLDDYIEQSDKNPTGKKLIKNAGKWSMILTLKFIIPAIKGVFGHFTYSTKGMKSSLPQIRDSFDTVLNQAGRVSNIPFDLIVQKVKSQKPGKKYLFPVVSLVPNISQGNMELVSNYLNQGKSIKSIGLLTEEKILELTEGDEKEKSGPEKVTGKKGEQSDLKLE